MKLYHGTNRAFDAIDLLMSKPNKDFGRGFYLSPDYEQALNMARIKTEQQQEGEPIVMVYEVDETEMQKLQMLCFEEYNENGQNSYLLIGTIKLVTLFINMMWSSGQ